MLLRNCRILPELSDGSPYEMADIEIENGTIVSIESADMAKDPSYRESDEMIDCQGNTLLPGLFDLHTHISIASAEETVEDGMSRLIEAMGRLSAYTDLGITTVRDCGSCLRLAVSLRKAVESGVVEGPDIIASGYMLAPPVMEKMGCEITRTMGIVDSAEEMRRAARRELELGADFIKIYASASASKTANQKQSDEAILTREEIRAAVETAKQWGTYAAAHAHSRRSIELCIEEGVKSIEHGTYIDDELISVLKQHREIHLVPTLAVMMPESGEGREEVSIQLSQTAQRIGKAYRAGLRLGFGTDLYNGDLTRFHDEFWIRRELCGMKNIDILLQATKYSAEIAGLAGKTGEIKEGLAADLILVEGNPKEDISVMYQKPKMVFQHGRRLR